MKKIVLASGGLDSTALLATLPKEGTIALFFNYGQKCYNNEYKAIIELTKALDIPLIERDITNLFISSRSDIIKQNNMEITKRQHEVECRNLVFVAAAISLALQLFPEDDVEILLGAIQVRVPYFDCSEDFIKKSNELARLSTNGRVTVSAPFINIGKDKVLEKLLQAKIAPTDTWSCYYGETNPCGECPACIDRKILGVDK